MKLTEKLKTLWWIPFFLYVALVYLLVFFEKENPDSNIKDIWDGLWYSMVTLTTVGYGDFYPITPGGKIIGLIIILCSLGVLGYLIGNLSNIIRSYMEKRNEGYYGTDFKKHFVIFGWDKFGQYVTEQIVNSNNKVAIITNSKTDLEVINSLYKKDLVFALYTDYHNYEAIKKSNIEHATTIFINFVDDTETLVYLINLKKYFPHEKYVVSLDNPDLKETYKSISNTYAISKNEITSKLVASYIFEPDVATFTEDIMSTTTGENDCDLQEYMVTKTNPFVNKDYLESFIELKKEYNCVLIGFSRLIDGEWVTTKNPATQETILENDHIIILSNGNSKKDLENKFKVREGRHI